MNVVILIGNLASDIVLHHGETSDMASFRLAVSKDFGGEGADFINCKAFGKTATNLERYKAKGDQIAVIGRIESGSYKNREGKTVYTTDVICSRIEFTRGSKGNSAQPERNNSTHEYTDPSIVGMVNGDLPDSFAMAEEDIPF